MKELLQNLYCSGAGPHDDGVTRVLPLDRLSHGANMILCWPCYSREMSWRAGQNRALAASHQWDIPTWESLEIYP